MKQSINFTDFTDAFNNMDRQEQFTYDGKKALFEHLEQLEEDCDLEFELDVIALCCEYAEYSDVEELFDEYNNYFDEPYDHYTGEEIGDIIGQHTTIIHFNNSVIIEQF